MNNWMTIATVALAHWLAAASPGPDFFLVVRNSMAHGRFDGVWTSLGIMSAVAAILFCCLNGLAFLLNQQPLWLAWMQGACGGYLLYLAFRTWPKKYHPAATSADSDLASPSVQRCPWQPFSEGLFCHLLNAKALLFYFGLFSALLDGQTPLWVRTVCASEMTAANFLWFAWVARTIHRPYIRAFWLAREKTILRGLAILLALLGLALLVRPLWPT